MSPGTVHTEGDYNMDIHAIVKILVSGIFSVQAYHHLLTVMSSIITRKLNPRVYDGLLVLLDAVRLYRVYRWL